MHVTLDDSDMVEIEGVKATGSILKQLLNEPPVRSLLNIKRNGNILEIRRYDTVEGARKFFDDNGHAHHK